MPPIYSSIDKTRAELASVTKFPDSGFRKTWDDGGTNISPDQLNRLNRILPEVGIIDDSLQ